MASEPVHQQRLLVMPEDGVGPVVDLIDQARSQLLLKQFKLQSPRLLDALQRAHGRGVEVKVMLNPHTSGGDRWNDDSHALLAAAGLAVRWTSEAFPVTHEKSIVIDRERALISTFNLADKYFEQTRDYAIVTTAAPAGAGGGWL